MLYELISFNFLIEVDPCQVFLEMADCSSWSVNNLRILRFWYKLIYFPSTSKSLAIPPKSKHFPHLCFKFWQPFLQELFKFFFRQLFYLYFCILFLIFFISFIFSLAFMFHFSLSTDPSLLSTTALVTLLTLSNLAAPQVLIKSISFHLTVLLLFTSHILYIPCNLFPTQLPSFPPQLSWNCYFIGCRWLSSCQIQLQF